MAVNSIAQTLGSNLPALRRFKILIHGQEVDTLAGNVDLTGFFDLNSSLPQATSSAPRPQARRCPLRHSGEIARARPSQKSAALISTD